MDLNKKAIKVNNIVDAKKVIAFFKENGCDTHIVDDWEDTEYYRTFPCLCVEDGCVDVHSIEYANENRFELIQLPVDISDGLSVYKEKLMYVSNYPITDDNIIHPNIKPVFMKHGGFYFAWSDTIVSLNNEVVRVHPRMIQTWKYAMDVPPEDKNKQELIKKADELIKLSDELVKEGNELKAKAVSIKAAANKL